MIRNRKRRRAPPNGRVAAFAFAAVCPMRKLPAMRIGFVAISACIVRDRSLEVPTLVTAFAWDIKMLAEQRKCGLGVIEDRRET